MTLYMRSRRAWAVCESRALRARSTTGSSKPLLPWPPALERAEVCTALGVSRSWVSRGRRWGVTLDQADTLAISLGLHPVALWPEWVLLGDPLELGEVAA